MSGETNTLRIEANGAGNIDTHKLRASEAVAESNGVSRIELHATDKLDVTVSGPSQVIYEGDPEVKKVLMVRDQCKRNQAALSSLKPV